MEDSFIGQKFGVDGHLEVVGKASRTSPKGAVMYLVLCHICKSDKDLFGDGIFKSAKHNLKAGCIPCGCAKRPSWSKAQQQIRVKRACEKLGLSFCGFVGDWKGVDTKLKLMGNKDGKITTSASIDGLMKKVKSDYTFADERMGRADRTGGVTKPDQVMIEGFMSSGKFVDGTKFWRAAESGRLWAMSCPKCSNDEYVGAGVCTGVFTSVAGSLKQGLLPCRCSPNFKWTQQQREFQIKTALQEEGGKGEFVGWKESFTGCESRAIIKCKEHGEWSTTVNSFVNIGTRCTRCAKTGFDTQKPAWVYILKITGASSFTGYGISNAVVTRLTEHRRKLASQGFTIDESVLLETSGVLALDTEKAIKLCFERLPQNVKGFRTEATHVELFEDVIAYAVSKLEVDTNKLMA